MTSERALAGGGRQLTISTGYSLNQTPGSSGQGSEWFGPGRPMAPQAPPQVAGRAFDFQSGINISTVARQYEPVSFAVLRQLADSYDLLRLIIETRKDAMERLKWVIQPRDPKTKQSPQLKNKIKALTKFWKKPDKEHDFATWLRMILEDHFVIDAASIHKRRTGSKALYSVEQIDGATIKRVLDDWGHTPEYPDIAYQQILKGMPAVNYTQQDLLYRPRNVRVHKIYGFSPVEQILMTINIGIRRQVFQLNFFTEGNIPPALIGVPETWTPDQIRTFQEWFDGIMAGNLAQRRRARFVPSAVGKTYVPTQETELFGKAEEWLARVCCFAFNVDAQPFIQMVRGNAGPEAARAAATTGLIPTQNWVKSFIDDILAEEQDGEDLEFIWKGDDEIDPVKRQQISSGNLRDGLITINEGRVDQGREPYDDPRFDEPMFMTSNGLAPLILTAAAQGAEEGKAGTGVSVTDPSANGKTPKPKPDTPLVDKSTVEKVETIEELIRKGDAKELAEFLRKSNLGTPPDDEEHDDE